VTVLTPVRDLTDVLDRLDSYESKLKFATGEEARQLNREIVAALTTADTDTVLRNPEQFGRAFHLLGDGYRSQVYRAWDSHGLSKEWPRLVMWAQDVYLTGTVIDGKTPVPDGLQVAIWARAWVYHLVNPASYTRGARAREVLFDALAGASKDSLILGRATLRDIAAELPPTMLEELIARRPECRRQYKALFTPRWWHRLRLI
jgi:hypothetical protein